MSQSEKMSAIFLGIGCLAVLVVGFGAVGFLVFARSDSVGMTKVAVRSTGGTSSSSAVVVKKARSLPAIIDKDIPKADGKGNYTFSLSLSSVKEGGKLTAKSISAKDPEVSVSILSQENAPNELALVIQLKVPEGCKSASSSLTLQEDKGGLIDSYTVPFSINIPVEIGGPESLPKADAPKDN